MVSTRAYTFTGLEDKLRHEDSIDTESECRHTREKLRMVEYILRIKNNLQRIEFLQATKLDLHCMRITTSAIPH